VSDTGDRSVAVDRDPATAAALVDADLCGRPAELREPGVLALG
jgi:hypothetical protein